MDFFEVQLDLASENCSVSLNFYSDNAELAGLHKGLEEFRNQLAGEDFTWASGGALANDEHSVLLRFFLQDRRGIIGVEVDVDNKKETPERILAHFYLQLEVHQLDRWTIQLERFIKGEITQINKKQD